MMKLKGQRRLGLPVIVLISVILSGCTTNMGADSIDDFGRFMSLKAGDSDKRDIYQSFGQPHDVVYTDISRESLWVYYKVKSRVSAVTVIPFVGLLAGGNDMDARIATFYFDNDGKFIKTETHEKSKYVNMWVGTGAAFGANKPMDRVGTEMEKLDLPFDQLEARKIKGIGKMVR